MIAEVKGKKKVFNHWLFRISTLIRMPIESETDGLGFKKLLLSSVSL